MAKGLSNVIVTRVLVCGGVPSRLAIAMAVRAVNWSSLAFMSVNLAEFISSARFSAFVLARRIPNSSEVGPCCSQQRSLC